MDRNEVVVGGSSARAIFHSPQRDEAGAVETYLVRLESNALTASLPVDNIAFHEGVTEFFQELETNWRGWHGTKNWRSYAGELALEATSSPQGLIAVRFAARPLLFEADWQAALAVPVEPGQLRALVGRFAQFFRHEP